MNRSAISVIAAGVLWRIIGIFIRAMSGYGLGSIQIAAVRAVIAAVCFVTAIAIKGRSGFCVKLKDLWMFAGMGIISVVLFNCLYFYTMIHSQASVAVVLLYTSPVFIMLLSAVLFGEKITRTKVISLVMTFAGCVLVAGIVGSGYSITPRILMTGLGSGLFYAMYTLFGRAALKKYDTSTVTAYTFIFAAAGILPIAHMGEILSCAAEHPMLILWCIGIGIACTVLPYFLYTWGLKGLEPGKAGILAAVEPLVGALIGITVFHESHDPLKLTGIALITGAIIVLGI